MTSNATPLIYLAKANAIRILLELYQTIQIPQRVKEEVVDKGKKLGYHDAYIIEELIKKNKIIVHKLDDNEKTRAKTITEKFNIELGEAEVIILTLKKKEKTVIIDDKLAIKTAEYYKLKPIGTLKILLEATRRKIINKGTAIKTLNKLIDQGFRISIELYKEYIEKINVQS